MKKLTCFKSYDIRGEIGKNIDEEIVYRISRSVAQHFSAKSLVIGFDARQTSQAFADAAARGASDNGTNVFNIGLAGTEEMYWAVSEFKACVGIEITASHNPINYNGMKIVKSGSRPLDSYSDFNVIKHLSETRNWDQSHSKGNLFDRTTEARNAYVKKVLKFISVDSLKPIKVVVNSGNGAAGPTFDAIAQALTNQNSPIEFIRLHHTPDHTFPNGIPNPLLLENQASTGELVRELNADFGIAFDGDFDRCFFFDEHGEFIQSQYIVGLFASIFLEKEPGSKIVHDPRVIWNTRDIVTKMGGIPIQSKTGHSYVKKVMREHNAIYGGEMSAHHYFRDFAYCDSGMIPWMLMAEFLSNTDRKISDLIKERVEAFPSSGEINYLVDDPNYSIGKVLEHFEDSSYSLDKSDGVSINFNEWRFNLRVSNTEPLVRLNIESRNDFESITILENSIAVLLGGKKI